MSLANAARQDDDAEVRILQTDQQDSVGDERRISKDEKQLLSTEYRSSRNDAFIILVCFLGMITSAYSQSAGTVSLGTITRELHIFEANVQWVQSAFTLSSGCFLLFAGRLADIYGRKRVFLLGALWTTLFAIGCGFAKTEFQLLILRGVQGIGTSAIIPASLGILAHSFPPSIRRTIGFALFSAGNPFGGGLAHLSSGFVTEYAAITWRGVFFLNAGIAASTCVIGALTIDADKISTEKDPRVDWLGAALITTGLVLVMFALGEGPVAPHRFETSHVISTLVVGVLLVFAFIGWEFYVLKRTTLTPLMRLDLWTRARGRFAAMSVITFFQSCSFFGWILWSLIYYQNFLFLTPIQTMLRFLPMTITGLILNVVVTLVASRVPVVWLCVIGNLATGIACLLFATIKTDYIYWAYCFPASILSVWGADFVFASGTLFFALVALPHEQSVAGGIFQTIVQIASSFGPALGTIVHDEILKKEMDKLDISFMANAVNNAVKLKALKAAQWTNLGSAMIAMVLSLVFLRGIGVVGYSTKESAFQGDIEPSLDSKLPSQGEDSLAQI